MKNLSSDFFEQVEKLRAMDAQATKQPLYREHLDAMFDGMAERVKSRMRNAIGDVDFSDAPSLECAALIYLTGEPYKDRRVEYVISRVKPVCDMMHVAEEVFGINVFSAAYCVAQGNNRLAYAYFSPLLTPAVTVYRQRAASRARKGKSGRPKHHHYHQAIRTAKDFRNAAPNASIYRTVRVVFGVLLHADGDPPTIRTIENWIKREFSNEIN